MMNPFDIPERDYSIHVAVIPPGLNVSGFSVTGEYSLRSIHAG